jgi:pyruvate/2-oxoglutarate dehydrogenase complex dihydrolipoamide dehydrogenase (E3) component
MCVDYSDSVSERIQAEVLLRQELHRQGELELCRSHLSSAKRNQAREGSHHEPDNSQPRHTCAWTRVVLRRQHDSCQVRISPPLTYKAKDPKLTLTRLHALALQFRSSDSHGAKGKLRGKHILVACGTRPAHDPNIPCDGKYIFDADQILNLTGIASPLPISSLSLSLSLTHSCWRWV